MRVASAPQMNILPVTAPKAETPAPVETPAEPKETFGTRIKHEIGAGLVNGGNDWKMAVGGAAGIATATAATYAGVVGGAVLGGLLGGALGPMAASFSSHGVLPFLGTALATTKGFAFAGMAAGAVTGMAGGWHMGKAVAGVPGKLATAVGKKMLGYDPDAGQGKEGTMIGLKSKPMQILGTGLIGVAGAAPGILGGAIIGGGAASAASLISGLANGTTSMGQILSTGAGGAGVGAAIGAVAGIWGGIALLNSIRRGGGAAIDAQQQAKMYLQLDDKDKRLTAAGNTLETLKTDLGNNNGAASTEHNSRIADLDQRDAQIITDNKRIEFKNANEADLVEKRAVQLYDQTKSALQTREKGQDDRQVHLDAEDKRVNQKRADIQTFIDKEQNRRYDALKADLDGKYTTRKGQLEARDSKLHQQEANIPNVVAERVENALNPLRQELHSHQANAASYDSQAMSLHAQAQSDMNAIPGIQSETQSERQQANSARDRANSLRPEMQSLNSQVSSQRNENERRKMDLDRREQALQAAGK